MTLVQVAHEGSFLSCCLAVKNCQRTLFFVPKENEISDEDGTLSTLEEEAAKDPEQQGQLMQHVHVCHCALMHHGSITVFKKWCKAGLACKH